MKYKVGVERKILTMLLPTTMQAVLMREFMWWVGLQDKLDRLSQLLANCYYAQNSTSSNNHSDSGLPTNHQ